MKKIPFFIFVLCFLQAKSQDYVVTTKNDTLRGEVRILSYDLIDQVQVKQGGKKIQFTAIQVLSVLIGKDQFNPVQADGRYRMMKLLKPGFLSLYMARTPNTNVFQIEYFVKRDGSSLEVPNLGFRKTVASFLKDCSSMEERIESGELGKKNLDLLVGEYNLCLDNQTKSRTPSVVADQQVLTAIGTLKSKIENSQIAAKVDALEILKDITDKVIKGERVPNYQQESLKGLLKDAPDCQPDLEKVIALLPVK